MIIGSVHGRRTMKPIAMNTRRLKCSCGCKKLATYYGLGNGVALVGGCELSIRRWVRDGIRARKP